MQSKLIWGLLITLVIASNQLLAVNKTADYWKCEHKVGGKWRFGEIPNACDIAPFADESQVSKMFTPIIFDTKAGNETDRYMQAMYGVIRDLSAYYIKSRKSNVSATEIKQWQQAVFAIAHQESFWSHYRTTGDGHLKMLRGDYGHGHGLMQIDDRWHYLKVKNEGVGWHLINNLLYAFDIYYVGWQKAPSKSCVSSESSWRNRSRAAYSAYNGGASKICRFSNSNDRWAKNDKNFVSKYDKQSWLSYIDDTNQTAQINVTCFAEGNNNCPLNGGGSNNEQLAEGQLLQLEDGAVCLQKEGTLHCLADIEDAPCLSLIGTFDESQIQQVSNQTEHNYQRETYDRHLCPSVLDNVYAVGQVIKLQKATNIRATASGEKVGTATQDKNYQIIDFVLKDVNSLKRYYKIRHNEIEGYVYAGNNDSHQDWAILSTEEVTEQVIPNVGDWVEISAANGINMRNEPAGDKVGTAAKGVQAEILDIQVRTRNNRLYYKLNVNGVEGYIYGGWLQPDNSLNNWAKRLTEIPFNTRTGRASTSLWYTALKSCSDQSCDNTGNYLIGGALEKACKTFGCGYTTDEVVELEASKNGWLKVKVLRDNGIGWVKKSAVDWN